jgi:3',5'-cyclic AMP phosphodiesterase CpdA
VLLAQLSDPHIGADWGIGDPVAGLAATVEAIRSLQPQPDAVLVSGDLADTAADSEYAQVRELLSPLRAPVYVLPGNHDERGALRRNFGLPGAGAEPVQYSVDFGGELRLVVLDSLRPGEDSGSLDRERLGWLEAELTAAPELPTLIAMHHPPALTGIAPWDEIGLPDADRRALGELIARHRQVRRIVAGHVHHTFASELAGCPTLTIPSTFVQARLNFAAEELELAEGPAGFAVHAIVEGGVVSHLQPVG